MGARLFLLLLLVVLSSSPTYGRQQRKPAKRATATHPLPTQSATPSPPTTASATVACVQSNPTPQQNAPSCPPQDCSRDPFWPPIWSNWFLFAAAVGAGIVALCTLKAIQRQSRIGLIALRASRRSANAAKVSADVSRQQLEVAHRPWLIVDVVLESDLRFTPQGDAEITIGVFVRNTGSTPAIKVTAGVEMYMAYLRAGIRGTAEEEYAKLLERTRQWRDDLLRGVTIFPGEPRQRLHGYVARVPSDQFRAGINEFPASTINHLTLLIAVTYNFAFAPGEHQTGLGYTLIRLTDDRHFQSLEEMVSVPAARLLIDPARLSVPPD